MNAVDDAIQALWDGAGGATIRGLTNGLHYAEAPERPAVPYVRYDQVSGNTDRVFGGVQDEMLIYQFRIFSSKEEKNVLQSIWLALVALFDDANLSVSGYADLAMLRESNGKLREAGQWGQWARYKIWLEES